MPDDSPQCDWFQSDQIWACMHSSFMDPSVIGCDVSCWPCDDVSGGLPIGVDSYGRRWVRPALAAESRDATGARNIISSDTPVLLPRGNTYFELAACWQQLANGDVLEWFAKTICDCNDKCPEDPPDCDFLAGFFHTCFAFAGFRWKPEVFICTSKYIGHAPLLLTLSTSALGQAAMARTTNRTIIHSPRTWCTSNFGVFCWGHTENSDCDQPPNFPNYYNEPHHSLWDYADITHFGPRFTEDSTGPDDYQAAIDARNVVMEFIDADIAQGFDGLFHVDQLSSPRRNASPDANWNVLLDYWSAAWNPRPGDDPAEWVPFDDLPAVMEFPNSKLVNTGHPVIAEYVIMGVAIELSMVLHRRKTEPPCAFGPRPPEETHAIYPLVRMKVTAWMGIRVNFPDGAPRYLERTWRDPPDQIQLQIVNGYDQRFPRITPVNSDQVTYIDESDRRLDPPPLIVWQGHRGFFSDPPVEDRFHYDLFKNPDVRECTAVAAGLEGMAIPAIESHPDNDEGDRKRIWTGSMKINFPWS